jgi:hypothetical protein
MGDFSYRMRPHEILGSRFSAYAMRIRERQGLAFALHMCLYGVRAEGMALCMSLRSTYGVCDQPQRRGAGRCS